MARGWFHDFDIPTELSSAKYYQGQRILKCKQ